MQNLRIWKVSDCHVCIADGLNLYETKIKDIYTLVIFMSSSTACEFQLQACQNHLNFFYELPDKPAVASKSPKNSPLDTEDQETPFNFLSLTRKQLAALAKK